VLLVIETCDTRRLGVRPGGRRLGVAITVVHTIGDERWALAQGEAQRPTRMTRSSSPALALLDEPAAGGAHALAPRSGRSGG